MSFNADTFAAYLRDLASSLDGKPLLVTRELELLMEVEQSARKHWVRRFTETNGGRGWREPRPAGQDRVAGGARP